MKVVKGKIAWLLLGAFVAINASAMAQDDTTEKPTAASEVKKPVAKKPAKPRGRLPNYFSAVVSKTQREEIYSIQGKYRSQIADLQKQLDAVQAAMAKDIDAVLDDEQLAIVNKKREEASAQRSKRTRPKAAASE